MKTGIIADKIARYMTRITACFLCGAVFLGGAAVVNAAGNGLWYYYDFHVDAAHAAGIDGTGVKIADIDTMINPDVPWLSDANLILKERNITSYYGDRSPVTQDFDLAFHATDMVGVLQGNGKGASHGTAQLGIVPGATICHYAAVTTVDDSVSGGDAYEEAISTALSDGVDIIAIPAGGLSYYDVQYPFILEAIRRGIPVIIAHDNAKSKVDGRVNPEVYTDAAGGALTFESLPTASVDDEICYWPGMVTVQAVGENGALQRSSNVQDSGADVAAPGPDVMMQFYRWGYFEPQGGGCSCATVLTAGYMSLAMQKWPDATGNQILQLMLRAAVAGRTGQQDIMENADVGALSAVSRDPSTGYGTVNLDLMLSTNPVRYPDVNPILYRDLEQFYENAYAGNRPDTLRRGRLYGLAEELARELTQAGLSHPHFLQEILRINNVTLLEVTPEEEAGETDAADGTGTAPVVEPAPAASSSTGRVVQILIAIVAAALAALILVVAVARKRNDFSR